MKTEDRAELDAFVSFDVMALGGVSGEVSLSLVAPGLYHLSVQCLLTSQVAQDDWHVGLSPRFTPDFHWAPHLAPSDQHIIDQHAFRAPAVIVAGEGQYLAVLPDLALMPQGDPPERRYLDLDAPGQRILFGSSRYRVGEHVLFERQPGAVYEAGTHTLGLFLMVSRDEDDLFNPWRRPMTFLWERHGRALFQAGAPTGHRDQSDFVAHTYRWAFEHWERVVWQEFTLQGQRVGAPAFIVNVTQSPNYPGEAREREFLSIWNQAWFSSLRSASGLFRHARRTGNQDLMRRAVMTKELALLAPMREGLFPSVRACPTVSVTAEDGQVHHKSQGWDQSFWGNSDRNPYGDVEHAPYHILDMSWTALLMLRWYEELEADPRLLKYARAHGDALLRLQDDEGFFPAWIDPEDGSVKPLLRQSSESAMCVTFLLKLAEITGQAVYQEAALRCVEVLISAIVLPGRWEDFETYWSCCRWGQERWVGKRIPRNDMHKQCNFSIFWMAEALLKSHLATGQARWLRWGQRCLDELATYQAVWEPPYLYVPVFGGFGVMNADGEWLDSRQSLFAELFLDYGACLQDEQYTQRGLSALRASFAMMYCPELPEARAQWEKAHPFFGPEDYGFTMENYGHNGTTSPDGVGVGVFTIYDWGCGAASEAWERLLDHYGAAILTQ